MPADHKRLTEAYRDLFSEVREILNRHDLVGLIHIGAPEDEYEPEVETILPRLRDARGPEDATLVVREEFERWFSPVDLPTDEAPLRAAGAEIWAAWTRYRGESEGQ